MIDLIALSLFASSLFSGGLVLLAYQLSPHFSSVYLPKSLTKDNIPLSPVLRLAFAPLIFLILLPTLGTVLGRYFSYGTATRRRQIISNTESEERAVGGHRPFDESWEQQELEEEKRRGDPKVRASEYDGVIGFFHPFCNAGGGGERVLWAAIRATQLKYPKAICVVYTGDHEATKEDILKRAEDRFNIKLVETRVHFLYLGTRNLVLASTWPRFTLLGQSLGSLILLLDAFTLLVPDMFIDTMGYGFSLALAKWLKPDMPVGAYVHYPTISTDMLASLDDNDEGELSRTTAGSGETDQKVDASAMAGRRGLNAGAGKGWKGALKRRYWQIFAWLYSWAGGSVDVVMTNASWTQNHIRSLWGKSRQRQGRSNEIEVLFPPCAVDEMEHKIPVDSASEAKREDVLLYIAQFRPEKNHELVLRAFAELLRENPAKDQIKNARLVLVGSVRDDEDSKRVYKLRLLANELHIQKQTDFICNASWASILDWLRRSSIGINSMWNEHFGIGVVEYQAAGLISVVNDSGGPKLDIVVDVDGEPTGFHASTVAEYAAAFRKALELAPDEKFKMRLRARKSAKRFTEGEFETKWLVQLQKLILMDVYRRPVASRPVDLLVTGILAVATGDDLNVLFGPSMKNLLQRYTSYGRA